jgi:hypothetical protein
MISKLRTLFTITALATVLVPHALNAQAQWACSQSNLIMNGLYVVSGTGTITGIGPIGNVGLILYNGDGTGMVVFSTTSVNGTSSSASKVPASFTVNPDCTGSKTIGTTHFNFVISPDGNTINWIVTDNGVTMTGTGIRIRR